MPLSDSPKPGVSLIIPTFNGGARFRQCLEGIRSQDYDGDVQIVVVDSGSSDGTQDLAAEFGAEVYEVSQETFNHSGTRRQALGWAEYEYVVYMVQDAIPYGHDWLVSLVDALHRGDVVAVYGQQFPHSDADIYAQFEVEYYRGYLGEQPTIQSLTGNVDLESFDYESALRLIRFDNVCAIYKKSILEQYPFPDVVYGEDIAWAKEVITNGHKIMYLPTVRVKHSHNRSPDYRLRRTIIETIVCSNVLNRIRDDLSYVSGQELRMMKQFTSQLLQEQRNTYGVKRLSITRLTRYMVRHIPALKSVIRKLMRSSHGYMDRSSFLIGYKATLQSHVEYIQQLIREEFPYVTDGELSYCAKHAIASTYGRFLGEVFVSYEMKGKIPHEIAEQVEPYLNGV